MQRHFVSALFLAAFLAAPAVAAEKSRAGVGAVAPGASKESKKAVATKKKTVADKPVKVAQAEKAATAKNPVKTTRRMRGYGN